MAAAYVRRLTSAGPDTQTNDVQQLTSLDRWLTEMSPPSHNLRVVGYRAPVTAQDVRR
ncbi:MAG TPA: hypothetical protein VHA79_12085 [Mycobacteriales bacterium]|jgi:hypothetical protein|nr:hypothetical protein [Mycobacteriales bacterium]